MKCLITGAGGFFGSEIVRQAQIAGIDLSTTDRHSLHRVPNVKYAAADILSIEDLQNVMVGIDSVIHAAGLAHIHDQKRVATAPFYAINEQGTYNVARAAAKAGVKHFVLVSSVSVYGNNGVIGSNEESPCQPENAYADSKWRAEQKALEVAESTGMDLTILRMATLYGEGDPGNVGRLVKMVAQGRFVWIGNGSNRKSLIYRSDAARACITALATPKSSIYNVSAAPSTMREVVTNLSIALGRSVPRWHIPASLALATAGIGSKLLPFSRFRRLHTTVRKWVADDFYDATKFCKTFNFQPQVSLAEGLQREVAWYRQHTAL